jgi:glycerol uptake facilitator-like aquaporin
VSVPRRLAAEFLGTALLLAVIVGSGIMGERLAQGNDAITLLANALATGAGLVVLIAIFAPVSGAHFNPVVSLAEYWLGRLGIRLALAYVAVQVVGGIAGVAATHLMFGEPVLFASTKLRAAGHSSGARRSRHSGYCSRSTVECATARPGYRFWSALTSPLRTGSPPRPPSPIRP